MSDLKSVASIQQIALISADVRMESVSSFTRFMAVIQIDLSSECTAFYILLPIEICFSYKNQETKTKKSNNISWLYADKVADGMTFI